MLKLAGVLCMVAGCAGCGVGKILEERDRVKHLRELIRMIQRIQSEISYGKHTLPEICLVLSEYSDALYQPYFREIYDRVHQKGGSCLSQVWEEQMGKCLKDLPLSQDEKETLQNLPRNLGMQEARRQAESVGQSVDLLTRKCRQAEDAYENKARMILSVSLLAGIFLAILLV